MCIVPSQVRLFGETGKGRRQRGRHFFLDADPQAIPLHPLSRYRSPLVLVSQVYNLFGIIGKEREQLS